MYNDPISMMHSSTFNRPPKAEFANIKYLISSNPNYQNQNPIQNHQSYHQNQTSFFSNLLTGHDDFLPFTPSSTTVVKQERDAVNQDLLPPATVNGSRLPSNDNGGYGYTNQNLMRQNSTPAGFLSSLSADNGFASMNKSSSSSTLNNHISFSSGLSSSPSRFLPQIAENKNELHDSKLSSLKSSRDSVLVMQQNGETRNHTPGLVHHMSLPKTSSEMAVVDNFLQFQQGSMVPWRTRAKRGCATHPRSIAERERRTRISERIKRLQELFPDIDKHSNTADMLDMAVEYIKNLQKELETLSDARAKCKCSRKQLQSM